MHSPIQLLSIDFDGTLVSRASEPVFNSQCMELIRELAGRWRDLGDQHWALG